MNRVKAVREEESLRKLSIPFLIRMPDDVSIQFRQKPCIIPLNSIVLQTSKSRLLPDYMKHNSAAWPYSVPTSGRLNALSWLNLLHSFILPGVAGVGLYSPDVSCIPLSSLSILNLLAKPSTQIYIWKVFAKSFYTRVFTAKRLSECSLLWQAVINAIHYYCNSCGTWEI